MALADYFSKNILAISQVLKKGSNEQFREILNQTVVGIVFDDSVKENEGRVTLDLTVRLLSRLYPKLNFINHTLKKNKHTEELVKLSKAINSKIEIVDEKPTIIIVIGKTTIPKKNIKHPVFYVGSDGWIVKFSAKEPVGSGNSLIPCGAGVSACIGASNIFRYVFRDFIPDVNYDESFSLSLITLQIEKNESKLKIKNIDLDKSILVGFGAIGNGVIWTLANMPIIKGELTIVEPEDIEITNLQRYVLAEERHIEKPKIKIAQEFQKNISLKLNLLQTDWAGYLSLKNNWKNRCILLSIDNIQDRIYVQSSIPKEIINSYTENNLIGISRHYKFGEEACLMCTYMPNEKKKSYSQEVSDNLGLSNMENIIREYLYYNKSADEQLIKWIAESNKIDYKILEEYIGIPVSEFYAKVVCGGILLELRKDKNIINLEAPLAFQSTMAGILLISEIIVKKIGLRKKKIKNITHFYPLDPIKSRINPYTHSFQKDNTGRCICNDDDFLNAYNNKWNI